QIVVQSLSSGERKAVLRGGSDARYVPTGHLVYALGSTIIAVAFDTRKEEVRGSPIPILEGVMRNPSPSTGFPTAHFAFSESGSLAYVTATASQPSSQLSLALADRSGKIQHLELSSKPYRHPRVSPDGTQLAIASDDGKDAIVWIYDLKIGGEPRRLTFGGRNLLPIWTADSQY